MSRKEREGYIWILLAAAGFALIPPFVKTAYLHSTFEPLDLAVWRFILTVPLMWILVVLKDRSLVQRKLRTIGVREAVVLGGIFALDVLAASFALQRLPGSTYVVLLYSYPALVVILSMLLGEAIRPLMWLALAMATIGIGLTVPDFATAEGVDLIGVALALGNAVMVAVYFLVARRVLAGVEDVTRASAFIMTVTMVIMLLSVPLRGLQIPRNPATIFGICGIAALGTLLPVIATNLAIQRIGAARTSLAGTAEPAFSIFFSIFLLGEVILGVQWLGALMIISSVIVLQLRPRKRVDISIVREAS